MGFNANECTRITGEKLAADGRADDEVHATQLDNAASVNAQAYAAHDPRDKDAYTKAVSCADGDGNSRFFGPILRAGAETHAAHVLAKNEFSDDVSQILRYLLDTGANAQGDANNRAASISKTNIRPLTIVSIIVNDRFTTMVSFRNRINALPTAEIDRWMCLFHYTKREALYCLIEQLRGPNRRPISDWQWKLVGLDAWRTGHSRLSYEHLLLAKGKYSVSVAQQIMQKMNRVNHYDELDRVADGVPQEHPSLKPIDEGFELWMTRFECEEREAMTYLNIQRGDNKPVSFRDAKWDMITEKYLSTSEDAREAYGHLQVLKSLIQKHHVEHREEMRHWALFRFRETLAQRGELSPFAHAHAR